MLKRLPADWPTRIAIILVLMLSVGCPVTEPVVPPEPPSPVKVDSLKVLVWEESGERHKLPVEQRIMLGSADVRDRIKDSYGTELLILDPDSDVTKSPHWIQEAKEIDRDSLPWMMILSPAGAWIGPLPVSEGEVFRLLDEVKAKEKPPKPHKRGCN